MGSRAQSSTTIIMNGARLKLDETRPGYKPQSSKPQAPKRTEGTSQQASSSKQQASSLKPQAASSLIREPRKSFTRPRTKGLG